MGKGRRQERGDSRNGYLEEVGVKIVRMIFLPNYEPKIPSMHEHEELKTKHFFKALKRLKSLYVNAFIPNSRKGSYILVCDLFLQ